MRLFRYEHGRKCVLIVFEMSENHKNGLVKWQTTHSHTHTHTPNPLHYCLVEHCNTRSNEDFTLILLRNFLLPFPKKFKGFYSMLFFTSNNHHHHQQQQKSVFFHSIHNPFDIWLILKNIPIKMNGEPFARRFRLNEKKKNIDEMVSNENI